MENVAAWLRFSVVTSLGFDIPRALLAAGLIMIAGRGVLISLRRASRRAAFDHVVGFAPHDDLANASDPRTPSGN